MPCQLLERPSGQSADRIEGHVSEQFYPDFVPKSSCDGAPESSADKRPGNRPAAVGARTVRLAEADAIALRVMNDAWLRNVRREIRERSDDTPGFDGRGNHPPG